MLEREDPERAGRYCANCGSKVRAGIAYCVQCGKLLRPEPQGVPRASADPEKQRSTESSTVLNQKLRDVARRATSLSAANHPAKNAAQDLAAWFRGLSPAVQVGVGGVALVAFILFPRLILTMGVFAAVTGTLVILTLRHYSTEEPGGRVNAPSAPSPSRSYIAETRGLQQEVDDAEPGASLKIAHGEYEGPIVVDKPITLKGTSAVIWVRRGPALTVSASGVRLEGLHLEVTTPDNGYDDETDVALKLADGARVSLEDVIVRGRVVGLSGEDGEWRLPATLDLGAFAPREKNTFVFGVSVPIECRLSSDVAGLDFEPKTLEPGEQDITLTAEDIPAGTLIFGRVFVRTSFTARTIAVTGSTMGSSGVPPASDVRL